MPNQTDPFDRRQGKCIEPITYSVIGLAKRDSVSQPIDCLVNFQDVSLPDKHAIELKFSSDSSLPRESISFSCFFYFVRRSLDESPPTGWPMK